MKRYLTFILGCLIAAYVAADSTEDFPLVRKDLTVSLYARDPLVRNPCAITFDTQGRLFVGMGPQYRNPNQETERDSVFILIDQDGDGAADQRKQFATGFNNIQGLAWRGKELWVANAPDLTVVRDEDGDDVADVYVRLYTDLGNLEHGLHGLNWAPDGRLYMSKGNSKGLTLIPDRVAPKAFRELWGVEAPVGTPDFPDPVVFLAKDYTNNYHDPADDWGLSGGVLRCDADGSNLEIVSRGFRNPWDIAMDDSFNWLGTDNDQTLGDKIFSPFAGANFGWGHPWSYDWEGLDHLPSAPASGPLFEGSGTGTVYLHHPDWPEDLQGVFLFNDWLNRETLVFRPKWQGAWMRSQDEDLERVVHADGGRSMSGSSGRSFDPVDMELGSDGALYISSWGREYGAVYEAGEWRNEGRIYKIAPKSQTNKKSNVAGRVGSEFQQLLISSLHTEPESLEASTLIQALGSHFPVWRVDAQNELVRRGEVVLKDLYKALSGLDNRDNRSRMETWILWTIGRIGLNESQKDSFFVPGLKSSQATLNYRVQCVKILGDRLARRRDSSAPLELTNLLIDVAAPARLQHAVIQALKEVGDASAAPFVLRWLEGQEDRILFYSGWQTLRTLLTAKERKALLLAESAAIRRAALLSLLEEDALLTAEIEAMTQDADPVTASLATQRLGGRAEPTIRGSGLPKVNLLKAPDQPTTFDSALALLDQGNALRGRKLFLEEGGAQCLVCHRMEGQGSAFAPDLTGIGRRATPEFIVRSILDPSADITEGFVTHYITTEVGDFYSGILLQETGQSLRLALVDGSTMDVARSDIASRETLPMSAMPDHFAQLLGPQDVADIVSYLIYEPVVKSPVKPTGLQMKSNGERVEIFMGEVSVATYYARHELTHRPFFAHLRTPSGIPVTRNFPPQAGIDSTDHAYMHPGLSLGFADLNGVNFWHNREGRIVLEELNANQESAPKDEGVSFQAIYRYEDADGKTIATESGWYNVKANAEGFLLTLDIELAPAGAPLRFGVKEEMGLALRVATPITVKNGGQILSAAGGVNESGTWGKYDKWWDYSGEVKGKWVGIQLMLAQDSPKMWSHSRDYGVLVANPFPVDIPANRDHTTVVELGESLKLRFEVQIHETPGREMYDPAGVFNEIKK
jgi:putative membrane-bound dehydrogenase-like protein